MKKTAIETATSEIVLHKTASSMWYLLVTVYVCSIIPHAVHFKLNTCKTHLTSTALVSGKETKHITLVIPTCSLGQGRAEAAYTTTYIAR